MVTEMTGGYRLLVPAALAVFVSYLVQRLLSERFTYRSLYEAQVPMRADSPTHHVEQLQNAVRLVQERMVSSPQTLGRLDLGALLDAGVGVHLGGDQELVLANPRPESPWVGQPLPRARLAETGGIQVVAILRNGEVLVPDARTTLEAHDQLLLVLGPEGRAAIEEHLDLVRQTKRRP